MSWDREIAELRRREELARRMGGADKVRRQHEAGKLTVRERIDKLLDPGSLGIAKGNTRGEPFEHRLVIR